MLFYKLKNLLLNYMTICYHHMFFKQTSIQR